MSRNMLSCVHFCRCYNETPPSISSHLMSQLVSLVHCIRKVTSEEEEEETEGRLFSCQRYVCLNVPVTFLVHPLPQHSWWGRVEAEACPVQGVTVFLASITQNMMCSCFYADSDSDMEGERYTCISQYTTVYHSIPQYTMVYHSISQYTTVYHSIPHISQYTTVYHSIP